MSCNKKKHRNVSSATKALSVCRRKGRNERRAYECPKCGAWHLTSKA